MSDIKLFRVQSSMAEELKGEAFGVEKSLQDLIEKNLSSLLGVEFLASEYSTGTRHGGRIDTLGIDENRSPVIIEYKRALNENVINQGLFYLDWLMDHQAEFTLLVMKKSAMLPDAEVDWSSPRLLCIAGDFSRYDEHAVQQMNRSIELIRYRRFEEGFLILELVNAATPIGAKSVTSSAGSGVTQHLPADQRIEKLDVDLRDIFESMKSYLLALGDDVQVKPLKYYFAFRRMKNFACVEPQTKKFLVFVKVDPDDVQLEEGFTRDVRAIGHFGTGDLEITIESYDDLERAKHLLLKSYQGS